MWQYYSTLFMGMSYDSTNIMGLGYETIGMFLTCEEFWLSNSILSSLRSISFRHCIVVVWSLITWLLLWMVLLHNIESERLKKKEKSCCTCGFRMCLPNWSFFLLWRILSCAQQLFRGPIYFENLAFCDHLDPTIFPSPHPISILIIIYWLIAIIYGHINNL